MVVVNVEVFDDVETTVFNVSPLLPLDEVVVGVGVAPLEPEDVVPVLETEDDEDDPDVLNLFDDVLLCESFCCSLSPDFVGMVVKDSLETSGLDDESILQFGIDKRSRQKKTKFVP